MRTKELPLRERKKEQTRILLFKAALTLFEQQGFQATTVDQIAEIAGVSRRTYFRYFPSKEAVLFTLNEPRLKRFQEFLGRFADKPPFQQVKLAFLSLARDFEQQKEILIRQQSIIQSSPSLVAYETKLDGEWEKLVATAMQRKEDKAAHLCANVAAGAMIGVIRAALRIWFEEGGESDLIELGNNVFDMLEQGFRRLNQSQQTPQDEPH